jgi:hypothetical protein
MSNAFQPIRPDSGKIELAKGLPTFEILKNERSSVPGDQFTDIANTTATSKLTPESLQNVWRLRRFKEKHTPMLLRIIQEQDFEYGFDSSADLFIKGLMEINSAVTKEWLNSVFIDHFHDGAVIIGLLHIISHLDYFKIYPQGPTMAVAALSHSDAEVRECGIRAYENWGSSESLKVLKSVKCEEQWLQQYVEQVIADLEEELGVNAPSGPEDRKS